MRLISVLLAVLSLFHMISCGGQNREKTSAVQDVFFDLDESGIPMKRVLASAK